MILENYKASYASSEIYGSDINSILKDIMGVPNRNPEVAKQFEKFYKLLKDGKYEETEKLLDEI